MTCSFTTKPITPPTSILTKYEYFDTGTTGAYGLYGSTWFAQTRTTGTDGSNIAHTVSQIAIFGYRVGSPGTVTVSIRNVDANGQPTGNDLCSGTLNGNSWATSSTWYNFTMSPSTVVLNSNQKYAYIIRATNGDSNDYICIRAKDPNGYSGGTLFRSKNSGSSWSDYSSDAYFREYGYAQ
jgi:hypothetical protein